MRRPLIDPDVFRDSAFTTVVAIGFVFNFCLYGSIFCLAVGLGRLRGLDALDTGLALLPMTVVTAAMALLAGRLVPRLGEWRVVVAGLTSGAVGATLVALNASNANLALLLLCTVPIGFTALAMPAMTGLAMASGPSLRLGLSAGVFNASRQAGGALGVAVLGTLLTSGPGASVSLRRRVPADRRRLWPGGRARRRRAKPVCSASNPRSRPRATARQKMLPYKQKLKTKPIRTTVVNALSRKTSGSISGRRTVLVHEGAKRHAARVGAQASTLGFPGVLGCVAFVLVERTVRRPLIEPDVFRDSAFTTVVAIGFVFNFCLYGSIFLAVDPLKRRHRHRGTPVAVALGKFGSAGTADNQSRRLRRQNRRNPWRCWLEDMSPDQQHNARQRHQLKAILFTGLS